MTTETVTPEMRQRMREDAEKARQYVYKLAETGGKSWTLGIPHRPNHDHDYVLTRPCDDVDALLDALDQAEEQNDDMLDEIEWLWKQSGVDLNLEAAHRLGLILYRHDRLFAAEADDDE